MAKVLNQRTATPEELAGAIYVGRGRGSVWGNPYPMTGDHEAERERVCSEFRTYAIERLRREPHWLDPLRGKDLVCWCAPKQCHADILLQLANKRD